MAAGYCTVACVRMGGLAGFTHALLASMLRPASSVTYLKIFAGGVRRPHRVLPASENQSVLEDGLKLHDRENQSGSAPRRRFSSSQPLLVRATAIYTPCSRRISLVQLALMLLQAGR